MRPLVPVFAADPPEGLPIWVRLRLIVRGVRFESVTHWQRLDEDRVFVMTTTGLVPVAKSHPIR